MAEEQVQLGEIGLSMARSTPHAAALGLEFVSVEDGVAEMRVPYREDLVGDPATGVLAGGVITSLLDHVSGLAVAAARGEGATATLDLRIDYMRAAAPRRAVRARARCYKLTHAIAFVRATAFEDEETDPIAAAQAAFVLQDPRPEAPAP
ncbi:MAG TPA: PaaI family thioesterase [Caulobacteraceae bacterium]|nr:PaaI family thioesterase [Caulobacteraceae bacterium]